MAKRTIEVHLEGYILNVEEETFGFQAENKLDDTITYAEIKKTSIREFDQKHIQEGKPLSWIVWKKGKELGSIFKFHRYKPFTDADIEKAKAEAEIIWNDIWNN